MNSRQVHGFPGGFVAVLFMGLWLWHVTVPTTTMASRIVQRSDGCGPHPLVALVAASRPYGSGGTPSLNEVLRTVKANPEVWATMSSLLRRYDDCIRAGDGLHYKRGGGGGDARILIPKKSFPTDETGGETLPAIPEDTFPITSFF